MELSLQFKHALYLQILLQVLVMSALARFAFSAEHGDHGGTDMSQATINQENRGRTVQVQGTLLQSGGCNVNRTPAQEKKEASCTYKIHDEHNSHDFKIQGGQRISEDIQTLYQAGIRNVAVRGRMLDAETLSAFQVEKF